MGLSGLWKRWRRWTCARLARREQRVHGPEVCARVLPVTNEAVMCAARAWCVWMARARLGGEAAGGARSRPVCGAAGVRAEEGGSVYLT